MPVYEVFLKELKLTKPVLIAKIEAKNEERAELNALTELGMHWERIVNIETTIPEVEAKLKGVI